MHGGDINNDNIDNHIDEIQKKLLQADADELDKKKRISTKKEKALFDNNGYEKFIANFDFYLLLSILYTI